MTLSPGYGGAAVPLAAAAGCADGISLLKKAVSVITGATSIIEGAAPITEEVASIAKGVASVTEAVVCISIGAVSITDGATSITKKAASVTTGAAAITKEIISITTEIISRVINAVEMAFPERFMRKLLIPAWADPFLPVRGRIPAGVFRVSVPGGALHVSPAATITTDS